MRRLLQEPLLHFLLLGGALFGLHGLLPGTGEAAPDRIVVSAGQIQSLETTFARTWQRPPTAQELDGLIDDYVREEVLSREAQSLGLDREDSVIRRRLRLKMEFIADDVAAAREPTDAELQAYLDARPDGYRHEARWSFKQVWFDRVRRGAGTDAAAREALAGLQAAGAASARPSPPRWRRPGRAGGWDRSSPGTVRTWSGSGNVPRAGCRHWRRCARP